MSIDPCSVCGGTDLNLVDGYYYCVECGTQDVNARETVVEQTMLADGTFAHVATKKIVTTLKDGIEMSPEWYKWHAYNFILLGLTDELLALGAASSVKMKVLWIWVQYIKMFQQKEDLGKSQFQEDEEEQDKENQNEASNEDIHSVENTGGVENQSVSGSTSSSRSKILFEEDLEEDRSDCNESLNQTVDKDVDDHDSDFEEIKPKKKEKKEKFKHDINVVTKGVLLAILYVALNLDQSEIQLSHLCRFIREGRLSIMDCKKFVPKEIKISSTSHWKSFIKCTKEYTPNLIRAIAMTFFKRFDLGEPLVPDIRKIVNNFVKELCLPNDFKDLIFALMEYIPCNFTEIKMRGKKATVETVRTPDYETVIMSYIVVALKVCFGLDDEYEIKVSDTIDKINQEKDYQKSYKLSRYSNETDRLFSFREWCNFLQFRKSILCKFYLPMAQQHNFEVDDHVFMEHLPERQKRKIDLQDEVTLDILNKISLEDSVGVIPFAEFPPTLTPLSNYMEVILDYYQDPELKLLLSEDFTQYSLKYACIELKLPDEHEMLKGIKDNNKKIIVEVKSELVSRQADATLVYVRNCENKNWLKTKPPTIDHVTKVVAKEDNDKDSDHGYDSNTENVERESSITGSIKSDETEHARKLEYIKEEDPKVSIFDDQFDDIETKAFNELDAEAELYDQSHRGCENSTLNLQDLQDDKNTINDNKSDIHDLVSEVETFTSFRFDPVTFDREKTIRELILVACKKYKIPIPIEYSNRQLRKRKTPLIHAEAGCRESKRRRTEVTKPGEAKKEIERILTAYYSNMEKDVFKELADHVKTVIQDLETQNLDETAERDIDRDSSVLRDLSSENLENEIETQSGAATGKANDKNPSEDSILETNIENTSITEDLLPKSDPKFDEKTHDIKQLYIKFREEFDIDDYIDDADPEINEIITKNIEEFDISKFCKKKSLLDDGGLEEKADRLQEIREKRSEKEKERKKWEAFITNPDRLKEFYYWRRNCEWMKRTLNVQQKFDLELRESLPKSFSFVIQECAAIANCSGYMLYKCMQSLESLLI